MKGNWISADICNLEISLTEKWLLSMVKNLSKNGGCTATNKYFCDVLGISRRHTQRLLEKLEEQNLIVTEVLNHNKRIIKTCSIKKPLEKPLKMSRGGDIDVMGGVTSMSPLIYNKEDNKYIYNIIRERGIDFLNFSFPLLEKINWDDYLLFKEGIEKKMLQDVNFSNVCLDKGNILSFIEKSMTFLYLNNPHQRVDKDHIKEVSPIIYRFERNWNIANLIAFVSTIEFFFDNPIEVKHKWYTHRIPHLNEIKRKYCKLKPRVNDIYENQTKIKAKGKFVIPTRYKELFEIIHPLPPYLNNLTNEMNFHMFKEFLISTKPYLFELLDMLKNNSEIETSFIYEFYSNLTPDDFLMPEKDNHDTEMFFLSLLGGRVCEDFFSTESELLMFTYDDNENKFVTIK